MKRIGPLEWRARDWRPMEIGGTSSVQALRNAFDTHAARGVRLSSVDGGPRFEKDMAELPSDEKNAGVQTNVIRTKDQMLGDLLDIMA